MKKMFRRGLALVLFTALVLVTLPMATAAEAKPSFEYEYILTMNQLTPASTASNYPIDTAVAANAKFEDTEKGYGWKPEGSLLHQSSVFMKAGYRFSVKGTVPTRYPLGKNGFVMKFTVGESGNYKPYLTYATFNYGSKIKVYITDAVYDATKTDALRNYIADVVAGNLKSAAVGEFNTHEKDAKEFEHILTEEIGTEEILLEKNKDYYMVVSVDGENSINDYGDDRTYFYFQLYSFGLAKGSEIAESDEVVSGNVSFVATSNVVAGDMMNVSGFDYDSLIDEVSVGTKVTVSAPEKEGYEFKHWLRGTRDNGVYVSSDKEYSFTAMTNIYLTAVYESTKGEDVAVVEFYNGNGQYLESAEAKIGETVSLPKTAPTLTGFEFANQWKTQNGIFTENTVISDKLTRAVAQFEASAESFDITFGSEKVSLAYGSEKTFTSNNAVYWMKDNTVVHCGTSYTHAVWDDAVISTATDGEFKPVVLLDANTKNGAYMIEYNAADKEIVEAGIIFGNTDKVTIGSCSSKATSQRGTAHGQFTAKPYGSESCARGYLVYKDGNEYKVVYSA